MSASILREAAALMRERAEAATYVYAPHHPQAGQVVPWFEGGDCYSFDETDGPHIMAWSPAVALAVADWLDAEAVAVESLAQAGIDRQFDEAWVARETASRHGHALTVARTYLGRES